jgi:hypothetical protein
MFADLYDSLASARFAVELDTDTDGSYGRCEPPQLIT